MQFQKYKMSWQYLILYNYIKNVKHLYVLKQISVLTDNSWREIFNYLTFNLKYMKKTVYITVNTYNNLFLNIYFKKRYYISMIYVKCLYLKFLTNQIFSINSYQV